MLCRAFNRGWMPEMEVHFTEYISRYRNIDLVAMQKTVRWVKTGFTKSASAPEP
jgi:hypothetical protein